MRPSRSGTSISFTNIRLMGMSARGVGLGSEPLPGDRSSPDVLMTTISDAGSPLSSRSRATVRACQRARALPRVPIFMCVARWTELVAELVDDEEVIEIGPELL